MSGSGNHAVNFQVEFSGMVYYYKKPKKDQGGLSKNLFTDVCVFADLKRQRRSHTRQISFRTASGGVKYAALYS